MAVSYTFHKCLGRGGFGEVYLASRKTPEGLEKRVAVKVLRSDLPENELALARLKDEARMLTVLDHPAIVRVLELTRLGGQVALVTEYIDGIDTSRFCVPARLLPAGVVLATIGEVAGALDCAHTTVSPETGKPLRLVHRDVKPENVRLSRHGEAKLLDFGIARSPELAREARTTTGSLPFTPGYTAPEAFVALKQEPATDVFALGATMYRLLVGERYYEGVRLTEQAALSAAPPKFAGYQDGRMRKVPVHADADVVGLVRACLAYDPTLRPTARELQSNAEGLAEKLPGPPLRRFVRESPLPEERPVEGGPLTGRTLEEDTPGDTVSFEVRRDRRLSSPSIDLSTAPTALHRAPPGRSRGGSRGGEPPAPAPARFPWLMMGMAFSALAVGAVLMAVMAFAMGLWMGG